MIPGLTSDEDKSPNGWNLDSLTKKKEYARLCANRCRNLVIALENVLVQIGIDAASSNLAVKLTAVKEAYETEMTWHARQAGLYGPERRDS